MKSVSRFKTSIAVHAVFVGLLFMGILSSKVAMAMAHVYPSVAVNFQWRLDESPQLAIGVAPAIAASAGSRIPVEVAIRNLSKSPVQLRKFGVWIGFAVTKADGSELREREGVITGEQCSVSCPKEQTLAPGATAVFASSLSTYYAIAPGKYSVKVMHQPEVVSLVGAARPPLLRTSFALRAKS